MRPRLVSIPVTRISVGVIRVFGTGSLLYGLTVVVQGPQRWSGPSYATATSLAPSWLWGSVIAALGALALAGSLAHLFGVRNVGLYGIAIWLLFFAVTVAIEAARNPHVSAAGAVLYGMVAAAICCVARAREIRE